MRFSLKRNIRVVYHSFYLDLLSDVSETSLVSTRKNEFQSFFDCQTSLVNLIPLSKIYFLVLREMQWKLQVN